ncbi:MAG: hypothetical protein M0023_08665 [Desulfobacteraceae bacterium]|nr:hypothetical protein [Desulfobacteraceae bacterium]
MNENSIADNPDLEINFIPNPKLTQAFYVFGGGGIFCLVGALNAKSLYQGLYLGIGAIASLFTAYKSRQAIDFENNPYLVISKEGIVLATLSRDIIKWGNISTIKRKKGPLGEMLQISLKDKSIIANNQSFYQKCIETPDKIINGSDISIIFTPLSHTIDEAISEIEKHYLDKVSA